MVRLRIFVQDAHLLMSLYDKIKIYKGNAGNFTEITTTDTRINLVKGYYVYYYTDLAGTTADVYKYSLYNSLTTSESAQSAEFKSKNIGEKVGYTFMNYSAPPGEWGEAMTPDDIRFTYFWGIDMSAADIPGSSISDTQLARGVLSAISLWENELNIDIMKKIRKTKPASTLKRARYWVDGVDYNEEEDPYDYEKITWNNWGFIQLRRKPIISIERAEMFDMMGNKILDVKDWIRLYKESGQICIYPKGSLSIARGYHGSGIMYPLFQMTAQKYPHAFEVDYTTGFPSSDFLPDDLREVIGIAAAILSLEWIGDGLLAGFSSSSIGLDGLSEAFSSTQSATSAYFGARILSYMNYLKQWRQTNKPKYCNLSVGFI